MDANEFIAKLKSNGSEKDVIDLDKVFEDYRLIVLKLPTKDKGTFALNVLCVLCRNLDKVPQWRSGVDNKALLVLSIECVRGTRSLGNGDRVKTLACIYHIHRHVVRQNSHIPPELILKFSYMPFECDDSSLLKDYYKTYWSIIADRLTYIERLKSNKMNVTKLLPKLIEDLMRVVKIYDTVSFCVNLIVFMVKKLFYIFNENPKELNEAFEQIFNEISKDLDAFKSVTEKEVLDLYVKYNECLVVVTENALKINFKGVNLDNYVRNCIKMLGHCSDMFHCLQTFLLNGLCCIFNEKSYDSEYVATILKNLTLNCETSEKLGYKAVTYATYPFLNQYIKMYIENILDRSNSQCDAQTNCLKLMLLLMKKLAKTNQLLKCENCPVKSGLHDSLRLSFLAKNVISNSIIKKIDLKTILPYYYKVIEYQYSILYELRGLGCSNFDKCFRKLQTDIHNTAISLNKSQNYEFSIKTFNIYLINEIKNCRSDLEVKNISRGLYNKSICELDCKLYEQALKDAYLSLVLGNSEPSTEKYMSLVMDIKAKMLKIGSDDDKSESDENQDYYQMMTVLDVTKMLLEENIYGDLRPFVKNLKFSKLLKHEFSMYTKLWPSIVPIAGVWKSLNDMAKEKHDDWLPVKENREGLLKMLYEIVIETPTAVRSIHTDYYKEIVLELVENLEEKSARSCEEDLILGTLLFLKTEYDLAEATEKYGWKTTEHTVDPDLGQAIRTIPQEHHTMRSAVKAVQIWTKVIHNIKISDIPPSLLHNAMKISEVTVQHFLHMQDIVHGLQLASVCCELALHVNDKESYIRNAGDIISCTDRRSDYIDNMISVASKYVASLLKDGRGLETCLVYICDVSMYYNRINLVRASAALVAFVQTRILEVYNTQPNMNLDLSIGRLMEAQFELLEDRCPVQTILSSVNNIQRHYIAIGNTGTTHCSRRYHAASLRRRSASCGGRAVAAAFTQRLFRRARAAAAATLPRAAAVTQAAVYMDITNVCNVEDTQVKIDNRLKHILGLQPTNETQPHCLVSQKTKPEPFTPKTAQIETMLECEIFKKTQISPSVPCITIPAFKIPDFLNHNPTCRCYACETLTCDLVACKTCGLEAAMFFRAKEYEVARNYYEGTLKIFELTEQRLDGKLERLSGRLFDKNILDIVKNVHKKELKRIEIEFLIDASLFELAQGCYEKSDEYVVRIHELMSETSVDLNLRNEVYNLMVASAQLRRVVKTPELGIESDFDSLKLSPKDNAKTPETKFVPIKKSTAKIVKAEELPNVKRKVIKLNLDDNPEEEVQKKPEKPHFKVPIPITNKPAFENITPRTRSKPDIKITHDENTPNSEFFTPQSTPNEVFFTPMSVKTYGKVVKNLEAEFSTPKSVRRPLNETKNDVQIKSDSKKVNEGPKKSDPKGTKVEKGSIKTLRDKRSIKRATSPGKLGKEEKTVTRSRRRNLLDDSGKM